VLTDARPGHDRYCGVVASPAPPVPFNQLASSDLTIERVYQGGTAGNWADDPLAQLLPVGNQGGFRTNGSPAKDEAKVAVLFTSGAEPDWPDALDVYTGSFTYYSDNRPPGRDLHDTPHLERAQQLMLASYQAS
jgi:hypothetical protein